MKASLHVVFAAKGGDIAHAAFHVGERGVDLMEIAVNVIAELGITDAQAGGCFDDIFGMVFVRVGNAGRDHTDFNACGFEQFVCFGQIVRDALGQNMSARTAG